MKAYKDMLKYMTEHNYTIKDYPVYSRDPQWRRLSRALIKSMAEKNNT